MPPQRNLAQREYQQFGEDNDAGYKKWIQEAMGNNGYSSSKNSGAWARRGGPRNYVHSSKLYGVEFQWEARGEKKNDAQKWNPTSKSTYHMGSYDSTSARSQAIAKHQKEMMKLVQDMTELNYELTLQDIVEKPSTVKTVEDDVPEKGRELAKEEKKEITGKRENVRKNQRMEGGVFLLKMMFSPLAWDGRRRTKCPGRGGSKVSPKHVSFDGQTMYEKTSRSSSSSKSDHRSRGLTSCWSFYSNKKQK